MVLADTGPLYALVDRSDAWHERVVAWWETSRARVVVPVTVIPEVAYLLHQRIGARAESAFLRSLVDEEMETEPFLPEDLTRTVELVERYSDLGLGFVDASVVAMAERLDARHLLTTDRRHFHAVRPVHVRSLALVP